MRLTREAESYWNLHGHERSPESRSVEDLCGSRCGRPPSEGWLRVAPQAAAPQNVETPHSFVDEGKPPIEMQVKTLKLRRNQRATIRGAFGLEEEQNGFS